jgi:hypothetical protein
MAETGVRGGAEARAEPRRRTALAYDARERGPGSLVFRRGGEEETVGWGGVEGGASRFIPTPGLAAPGPPWLVLSIRVPSRRALAAHLARSHPGEIYLPGPASQRHVAERTGRVSGVRSGVLTSGACTCQPRPGSWASRSIATG